MAPAKRAANGGSKVPPWDSDQELDVNELDLSGSDQDDSQSESVSGSDDEGADADLADAVQDYLTAVQQRQPRRIMTTSNGPFSDTEAAEEPSEGLPGSSGDEEEQAAGAVDQQGPAGEEEDEVEDGQRPEDPGSDSSEDERPNRNTIGNVPLEWYQAEEHVGYDADGQRIVKSGRRDALERLLARTDSAKSWRTLYDEYNDEEIVLSKEEMRMIQRIRQGQFPHVELNPFEEENDWFSRDQEVMPLSGAPEPKSRFIPSKWEEKKVVKLVRALRKGWLKRTEPQEKPETYLMWEDDDPESLVPKLPKPQDLHPFPTLLSLRFLGHRGPVRSLSSHPSGQWLLSGADDGTVRLWEVRTGRCMQVWQLGERVACVAWCPDARLDLAAAAVGSRLVLLPVPIADEERSAATEAALEAAVTAAEAVAAAGASDTGGAGKSVATWRRREGGSSGSEAPSEGVQVEMRFPVRHVAWHARGDYFSTTAPTGNTQAVLVHQLSRGASQNPFRKNRGRAVCAVFHPSKPFFFVATQQAVRVYNLAKQSLAKKLVGGSGVIATMDIHPTGDHLLVGSEDRRLAWYDLDLSSKPYRSLRYHGKAVRGAAFHPTYPLFASASDDATAHVFHGRVYADLMTNPLIVPVKILRGHTTVAAAGVLDVAFHPTQPWLFTAGADASICLFINA